jgi:steroid delta-isomerase-like uncharacterized protein
MTREEILALCQRQLAAWNAHDPAAVAEFFAQDATLRDAGGETATGRDAIAARAKMYMDAFPDLRLDIASIEVDGDKFVMEWKASGTNAGSLAGMAPTNNSVVVEGCDVAQVGDDGLIHSETDYWNEASMMRQLGVMPEPAAAAQPA